METDFISGLLELGTSGILVFLFLRERTRSTEIMEARIQDLKERVAYLEAILPPTLAQWQG